MPPPPYGEASQQWTHQDWFAFFPGEQDQADTWITIRCSGKKCEESAERSARAWVWSNSVSHCHARQEIRDKSPSCAPRGGRDRPRTGCPGCYCCYCCYGCYGLDLMTGVLFAVSPRGSTARTPTAPGRRHLGLLRSRPDPVRARTRASGPAADPHGDIKAVTVACHGDHGKSIGPVSWRTSR